MEDGAGPREVGALLSGTRANAGAGAGQKPKQPPPVLPKYGQDPMFRELKAAYNAGEWRGVLHGAGVAQAFASVVDAPPRPCLGPRASCREATTQDTGPPPPPKTKSPPPHFPPHQIPPPSPKSLCAALEDTQGSSPERWVQRVLGPSSSVVEDQSKIEPVVEVRVRMLHSRGDRASRARRLCTRGPTGARPRMPAWKLSSLSRQANAVDASPPVACRAWCSCSRRRDWTCP